ncbi:MAG: hypothetical protein B6A08_02400 [Sorangiineae bacterium NIC37A_2]|nr:MAG: hypothetical protein B6A08_02400 [Sorangiineae bacterium NIC37A_2]
MPSRISIQEISRTSGVKFGTSGARGLVVDMTDRVCAAYTLAFLQSLENESRPGAPLAIGGDLRPSTPRILSAIARAAQSVGREVRYLGLIPSPAVALYGLEERCPTVMVTGSHIPADRNGMKFTTERGEITKADEARILAQQVELSLPFDESGQLPEAPLVEPISTARERYVRRYLEAFPKNCLAGIKLGVYGHSAAGREVLHEIYAGLGAEVERLFDSTEFIPVDTEAIRPEDVALALDVVPKRGLFSLVSTDGDSDRPLTSDEHGRWFRGDISGILTSLYFSADGVSCPVSCNSALELSGVSDRVRRTRIGSPFVIEGMQNLLAEGAKRVVGYEANGGFLHVSPLPVPGGGELAPLPTRDPVIVHLAMILLARARGKKLSELSTLLPPRVTASDRDPSFATARSTALIERLTLACSEELAGLLGLGGLKSRDTTDGLRLTFESGEIVHLRPSGNAPELRVYAEAETEARAQALVRHGLEVARRLA